MGIWQYGHLSLRHLSPQFKLEVGTLVGCLPKIAHKTTGPVTAVNRPLACAKCAAGEIFLSGGKVHPYTLTLYFNLTD